MKKRYLIFEFAIILLITFLIYILILPRNIKIYGIKYNISSTKLDFSNLPVKNANDYLDMFKYFPFLEEVDYGNQTITYEEKKLLEKTYPSIKFKVNAIVNLCGESFNYDIKKIDLTNSNVNENILNELENFEYLKEVNLIGKDIEDNLKKELVNKYPNIVFKWNVKIEDLMIDSNEEKITLGNIKINDVKELALKISALPNLKEINFVGSNLTNEELDKIRKEFPNINIYWEVKLGRWTINTNDIAFSVLIKNYPYIALTSKDLDVLKYCDKLQALDLGHQYIEDASKIFDYLPELRILILADNRLNSIEGIGKLKHLHYVELFMNNIKDVTPLLECKELVDVNVSYNLKLDVSPLVNLDYIERLWVVKNPITKDLKEELNNKFPEATIIYQDPSGSTGSGWRTHQRYRDMIDMFNKRNYIAESFSKYDK